MFLRDNNFLMLISIVLISIVLLLFVMPLYAENGYLFPGDVSDQSKPFQYDAGRVNRYASQKPLIYPQTSRASMQKPVYPDSDGVGGYKYYKYNNSNTNYSQKLPPVQRYKQEQLYPSDNFSRDVRYPGEDFVHQLDYRKIQQKVKTNFANEARNIKQKRFPGPYPKLLYPSDMETNWRSINKSSYSPNSFSSNSFQSYKNYSSMSEVERPNRQIQYVPVPVYSVPGTLPGTVPGVVTPGKMVPGYSHLSPDYSYGSLQSERLNSGLIQPKLLNRKSLDKSGINSFTNSQYNPLTGSGLFPGGSSPFDSFYKTYGSYSRNISPFGAPDSMVPGLSMPGLFLPQ